MTLTSTARRGMKSTSLNQKYRGWTFLLSCSLTLHPARFGGKKLGRKRHLPITVTSALQGGDLQPTMLP